MKNLRVFSQSLVRGVRMKRGLILEGGAMRGMFTAGVLDVFMENGIEFDGVVGVSAGAVFGCNFKSKQIGRTIRYNVKYIRDKRYCSLRSLIKTGDLFGAEFCYHTLPNELDVFDTETFKNNPVEFYVTCTDVETGEAVYHKCSDAGYEELEWMRASASLPLASRIVEIEDKKLLDGGIVDSIPLKFFEKSGYNRNVVILTQPKEFVKKENKLIPLMKILLRKYPKVVEKLENRHINYNETAEYVKNKARNKEIYLICPEEKLPVSRLEKNPEKLYDTYMIGKKTALKHIFELKSFLAENFE